jgi:transcriptional regulator with XRE-family HTH domain
MAHPSQSYAPNNDEPGSEGESVAGLVVKPLTWEELAGKLGVTRQAVAVWRKRADAPLGADLDQWADYVKKNELGGKKVAGTLKDEKTRHEIELLKSKIAREQRRVIDRDEVNQLLLHIATRSRTMLYQFLETELAPKLDGMSAVQMRPILRETADSIADMQADLVEQFQKQ